MEIQTPMISIPKEKRIMVNGNEVILKVSNVPVIKSLNSLVALASKLQEDVTAAKIRLLSSCDLENDRLGEIEDKINSYNPEEALTKADLREFTKLTGEYDIIEESIKLKQVTEGSKEFSIIAKNAMEGVLRITCPEANISESLLEAVTFSDVLEIVELFIQVNKLDILPKKLLPQKLREQILRLVSGEV